MKLLSCVQAILMRADPPICRFDSSVPRLSFIETLSQRNCPIAGEINGKWLPVNDPQDRYSAQVMAYFGRTLDSELALTHRP